MLSSIGKKYNKTIGNIYNSIISDLNKPLVLEADLPPVNQAANPFPVGGNNTPSAASLEPANPNDNQPNQPSDENTDTKATSGEEEQKQEEKVDIRREYEEALTELLDLFNNSKDNKERTNIKLKKFKGEDDNYKSFMIVYDVPEDKEIYLDSEKYLKGEVDLGLNEIFYNDLQSIAKDIGISKINWKTQDGVNFGTIELKDIDELVMSTNNNDVLDLAGVNK